MRPKTISPSAGLAVLAVILLSAFILVGAPPVKASRSNVSITSDSDFLTCGCVSTGTGSASNPYVLSGLTLYSSAAPGLLVDNTGGGISKYFDVAGDTVTGGNGPPAAYPGIEFKNLNGLGEITGFANTFSSNSYGILLLNSQNILIDGGSSSTGATVNGNGRDGVAIVGGGHNTVENIQVNRNGVGVPEGFFGGGRGISLNNTGYNTIYNVVLSEDSDNGIALFGSSFNTINGISIHYPDFYGAIVDGGSGNTIENSVFQTGDYVGLWLRDDTTGNTVIHDQIVSNGPTGHEKNPGIVPYFTVGLYLSSGAVSNNIEKNYFNNGNTGGSIIQDNGAIVNAVQSPIQSNNLFNDPATGNEPSTPLFPSGPAGANFFCGNSIYATQGVPSNPPC